MFLDKDAAQKRYDICKSCDRLEKTLAMCKECGCFMKAKVKFKATECPLGKWQSVPSNKNL